MFIMKQDQTNTGTTTINQKTSVWVFFVIFKPFFSNKVLTLIN